MVTQEENETLTKPCTIDEVKHVTFSMEKNTAPRPDHIPVEFYQACWEIEVIMIAQDDEKALRFAELFNCAIGSWPMKYLGVPVSGSIDYT